MFEKSPNSWANCANDQSDHFDFDSCLAATDEVGEQLFAPAFAAIRVR
jgi:hypothetical protein